MNFCHSYTFHTNGDKVRHRYYADKKRVTREAFDTLKSMCIRLDTMHSLDDRRNGRRYDYCSGTRQPTNAKYGATMKAPFELPTRIVDRVFLVADDNELVCNFSDASPRERKYICKAVSVAPALLAALQALLPSVDSEIEQRKCSGNAEDWSELESLSDAAHAAVRKAMQS